MSTLQSTTPQIISTDDAARTVMTLSAYVTPENLRAGDPAEREATHLVSADDKFVVGSWSAQPYTEFIESYPGDEYARVLEGSVTLTGDDGVAHTISAGEAFTLRRGWRGEYRVTQPLLKQFALYLG
ncbi:MULTISPECIES: cupin domain-containing protein [unclassified Gordonia (in: high G+C Gram-positive bacteria)]|uniref:cupin domain-containing protein n=1 Tax=unclassified Gordonia (in: high G+C Gram-positive bacteria) TaxID=2657482 RepID=UPI00209A9D29|nr:MULTISPECIES: cupin domain-containing protein [unclassified Gordonia (in: high G+C Gram-positive bacteria)]MDF3283615.1 cupin domain-containing protein [Gordonia sp. N1V]